MLVLQELLLVIILGIFDCLGLSTIVLVLHLFLRELLLKDKSKGFRATVNELSGIWGKWDSANGGPQNMVWSQIDQGKLILRNQILHAAKGTRWITWVGCVVETMLLVRSRTVILGQAPYSYLWRLSILRGPWALTIAWGQRIFIFINFFKLAKSWLLTLELICVDPINYQRSIWFLKSWLRIWRGKLIAWLLVRQRGVQAAVCIR